MDFDSIQSALQNLGASTDAAESHGTLCGLLLDQTGIDVRLGHTFDEMPDRGDALAAEKLQVLNQLFELSREQLNAEDLSFELLLPDESDELSSRLLGLSSWCQGFLYGIGVSGGNRLEALDPQSQECLSDLLEISKLNYRQEPTEEAEAQFADVIEHVRLSVLMLNESMNPLVPAPSIQ